MIMEETKKCPYCGEEILATAKKCKYCGEWLQEAPREKQMKPCPVCGEQIEVDVQVCPYCHEQIGSMAGNAPSNTTQPPHGAPYSDRESDEEKANTSGMFSYYFVDTFFKHYADFSGKIGRKKFWMSYLFYVIALWGFFGIDLLIIGIPILSAIFMLGAIIPVFALFVRRFHDTGKSGWWILINCVPFIGSIWLLILLCQKGQTESRAVKAKPADWIIIAASVILLIIGGIVAMNKASEMSDEYLALMEEAYGEGNSSALLSNEETEEEVKMRIRDVCIKMFNASMYMNDDPQNYLTEDFKNALAAAEQYEASSGYIIFDANPILGAQDYPSSARVDVYYVELLNANEASAEVQLWDDPEWGLHKRSVKLKRIEGQWLVDNIDNERELINENIEGMFN